MTNISRLLGIGFCATLLGIACSDDKSTGNKDGSTTTGGDGATGADGGAKDGTAADMAAGDGAVTGDGAAGDGATAIKLDPPPIGKGVQITMSSMLEPGETEKCQFWQAPPEGLNIVREEIKYTPGSHHAVLWSTSYKEKPALPADADAYGVFDCGKGVFGVWDVTGVVAVHQVANGPTTVDGLPSGYALKVPGNAWLLVNTHYLNASGAKLDTKVFINLHTVPNDPNLIPAGVLFLYNPVISIGKGSPANKTTATARMRCTTKAEINILNSQSHMHARGVDYVANRVSGDKTDLLYAGKEWSEVAARKIEPAMNLKAGEVIDFKCSYANPEDRVITQGFTTRDEMCVFWGLYYPRNPQTEYCSFVPGDAAFKGVAWGGEWVGDGDNTHDGTATAVCFQAVKARADLYACVVNSCPKISSDVSLAASCLATNGQRIGKCLTECSGTGDAAKAACATCGQKECAPLISAMAGKPCT